MLQEGKKGHYAPFLVGAVAVLVLLGGIFLLTRYTQSAQQVEQRLPWGATEQAYATQIRFLEPKMSRAANFLNQEVTFIFGAVANDGPRAVREIGVTLEFRDVFSQVVLRDTRRVLGPRSTPLASGQRRDFQFNFEHVPADWSRQYPSVRITGLLLD